METPDLDPDEEQRKHEQHMRQFAAIWATQTALAADLAQLLARVEARDRLWRGEDGFDG